MMQIGTCHGTKYKDAVCCASTRLSAVPLTSGLENFTKQTTTGKTAFMVARSEEPVILIIDTLPLRSLNLISILTHLDRSASRGPFHLTIHTPDEVEQCIDPNQCVMLIYNVGSASIADRETSQRLEVLTTLAPDVPLVVISHSECWEEVICALNIGAQGFVYAGTDARIVRQALSFVLNDRSHHPGAMLPKRSYPEQTSPTINCNPVAFSELDNAEYDERDLQDEGSNIHDLTERQKAVLGPLSRGESNKAIARRLGLKEGTVKVHVRQIMRKFGATNRTQVAVVCANDEGNEKLVTGDFEHS
jgi:DNA-binding NarL/FixJ family response regulator